MALQAANSIHPRVVNGRAVHDKVNTSSKRNRGVTERKIAAVEGHLERQPRDASSRNYLSVLKGRL